MSVDLLHLLTDIFFSYAPILITIFHFLKSIYLFKRNSFKRFQFYRIVIILIISNLLKLLIGVKRDQKCHGFKKNCHEFRKESNMTDTINLLRSTFDGLIYSCFSNHAFPSTHTLFYTHLYLSNRTAVNFIFLILGSISRIIYGHHRVWQVVSSFVAGYCTYKMFRFFERLQK
ncbi:hypothetical protein M153_59660001144 [Pseudoloma neurophilia]|uniref:Phosphatidic acid phosphatase type 2/haloperoxidase domain-containing protein n=1 Tax=Pseudoloma neurophilia TaxID=146866 RepID=A0A0R0M0D2_9MICR|nr:hypothetical protein M153_59660001144 [Pseudoloma neurophilia]